MSVLLNTCKLSLLTRVSAPGRGVRTTKRVLCARPCHFLLLPRRHLQTLLTNKPLLNLLPGNGLPAALVPGARSAWGPREGSFLRVSPVQGRNRCRLARHLLRTAARNQRAYEAPLRSPGDQDETVRPTGCTDGREAALVPGMDLLLWLCFVSPAFGQDVDREETGQSARGRSCGQRGTAVVLRHGSVSRKEVVPRPLLPPW